MVCLLVPAFESNLSACLPGCSSSWSDPLFPGLGHAEPHNANKRPEVLADDVQSSRRLVLPSSSSTEFETLANIFRWTKRYLKEIPPFKVGMKPNVREIV